jgi:alkyl hydroperoxide reductase subunit AhpC
VLIQSPPPAPSADLTKSISKDYEVLIEEGENAGVALRGLFIISPEGILRQKTVNDLPVGRSGEMCS